MAQDKIDRYHRSLKKILLLENYYSPSELEEQIRLFVEHNNNQRYHEALNNVTPADVYYGRDREILRRRSRIKEMTMLSRRQQAYSLSLPKRIKRGIGEV